MGLVTTRIAWASSRDHPAWKSDLAHEAALHNTGGRATVHPCCASSKTMCP
jgi:hypothetical protein